MGFYSVLILATIFAENDAKFRYEDTPQDGVHNTAAELAKLIHLVRGYEAKKTGLDDLDASIAASEERAESPSNMQPFDLDYFMARNKNPQALKRIMALLQKNYDAHKHHRSPGSRLHIISNPRVLEEYQRGLQKPKTKLHKPSAESEDTADYKDLLDLRRNAIFRLETSSVEKALRSKAKKNHKNINQKTLENDKFEDKEKFDDNRKGDDDDKKHRNDDDGFIGDDEHGIRKKGREDDSLKQDNAWDVITKKYEWNESKHKDGDSPKDRKEILQKKFKKIKRDDDWNKVTKQDLDNWDIDRIDKPKKNTWDEKKVPKKQKNFNKSYERPRNENKSYERPRKEKKSYERPRKEKIKNMDWDVVTTYKTTTRRRKSQPKDDWNKAFEHKSPSYYNNPRPKKSRDFENGGSGFFGRTPIPYVGRQGIYVD